MSEVKFLGKLGKLKVFYMPFSVVSHECYILPQLRRSISSPLDCFLKQYYNIQSKNAMASISNNIISASRRMQRHIRDLDCAAGSKFES